MISLEKEKNLKKLNLLKALLHPVYFPNIATMATLISNVIVWEAHDNYQKQTYRNRCYICTDQGKHMLTIPITHVGGNQGRQKYKDVQLDNYSNWQRQHWRSLQTAYRTSPFFEYYEDDLAPIFEKQINFLYDLNLETIAFIFDCLNLSLPIENTNNYESTINTKTITDYRYLVNAKKQFVSKQKEYNQVFSDRHEFIKNTSVIDLLFNEGPNTLSYLKSLSLSVAFKG